MEIDIAGMKVTLDTKSAMVRVDLPGGGNILKQSVEVVLLFGILAALTTRAKTK